MIAMGAADTRRPYHHAGVALLRSAVHAMTETPAWWPDPADPRSCRLWLEQAWSRPAFAEAIRQASPTLTHRIEAICAGQPVEPKQVSRATVAAAGYLLRALGRPTPFGLFAGVAPVTLGRTVDVRRGAAHRPVVRVDTQWLADVIDHLEARPELLERLDVVFSDLTVRRGGRLEAPYGPGRVRVRYTDAVRAVREAAAAPVRFGALIDKMAETFGAKRSVVADMLTELVRQGFLVTGLRAPLTITDPLTYVLDRLHELGAGTLPSVGSLLGDLDLVQAEVRQLNDEDAGAGAQGLVTHAEVTRRMRQMSAAGRTPLAVDLLLDCDVRLPIHVVEEMARAAGALLRLTRQPTGWPAWRDYHAAFCDRYGTGTLVPVTEVVDPDAGLGYPAGYPGSVLSPPIEGASPRDERLLALAWQAMIDDGREIVLTDDTIDAVAGEQRPDVRYIPPHVELAARIHAASVQAFQRGEYSLTVAPARAGGTLTSRFTPTATGSGLDEIYRALPVGTDGALAVPMSFPPAYPHAENVCRVPAYLPHVLSLGEHRSAADGEATIPISDLALIATRERLHLVSLARRQVLDPQVFHALALDKQPPPLARFLAHLPRAYAATWTVLDWGPYADRLPYLPRVRYRRSILAPARWRLTTDDLPGANADTGTWRHALDVWLARWRCPTAVELRDDDRSLRLALDEPIHAAILRAHLARHGHATITEASTPADYGWLDGHAHEIAVPMVRAGAATASPAVGSSPVVTNRTHGQWPGEPDARWLSLRIHAHPERHDEIITQRVPELVARLGDAAEFWFVRYRSPHQTDHLRLRIRVRDCERRGAYMMAVGSWAQVLHRDGVAGWAVFDSYQPEIGRYGDGSALHAAEAVFVADSQAVAAQLRHLPPDRVHPIALTVAGMVHLACGLLGPGQAMTWLTARTVPTGGATDRAVASEAIQLAQPGALTDLPRWPGAVAEAWKARTDALGAYHDQLPADADLDNVVESLLHMHHNRVIGIDPDSERTCRRLARQAAHAWQARRAGAEP